MTLNISSSGQYRHLNDSILEQLTAEIFLLASNNTVISRNIRGSIHVKLFKLTFGTSRDPAMCFLMVPRNNACHKNVIS